MPWPHSLPHCNLLPMSPPGEPSQQLQDKTYRWGLYVSALHAPEWGGKDGWAPGSSTWGQHRDFKTLLLPRCEVMSIFHSTQVSSC